MPVLAKSDLLRWAARCTLRDVRCIDDLRDGAVFVELFAVAWPRAVERRLWAYSKACATAQCPAYAAWDVLKGVFVDLLLPLGVLDVQGAKSGKFRACYPLLVLPYFAATLARMPAGQEFSCDFAHPVNPLLVEFLSSPRLVRSLHLGGGIPAAPLPKKGRTVSRKPKITSPCVVRQKQGYHMSNADTSKVSKEEVSTTKMEAVTVLQQLLQDITVMQHQAPSVLPELEDSDPPTADDVSLAVSSSTVAAAASDSNSSISWSKDMGDLSESRRQVGPVPVTANAIGTEIQRELVSKAVATDAKETLNDSTQTVDNILTYDVPSDLAYLDSLVSKLRTGASELETYVMKACRGEAHPQEDIREVIEQLLDRLIEAKNKYCEKGRQASESTVDRSTEGICAPDVDHQEASPDTRDRAVDLDSSHEGSKQRRDMATMHDRRQASYPTTSPFACHPEMASLNPALTWHQRRGSAEAVASDGTSFGAYTVQSPGGTPPSFSRNRSSSNLAAQNSSHNVSRSWDASTMEAIDMTSIWEKFGVGSGDPAEDHIHIHLHTSFDSLTGSPRHSSTNIPTPGDGVDAATQRDSNTNDGHGRVGSAVPSDLRKSGPTVANDERCHSPDKAPLHPSSLPPSVHDALEESRRKRAELLRRCQQHGVQG